MAFQNRIFRKKIMDAGGKEIFEIHPVLLGGSPADVANKKVLTREEHIEAVRYWNELIDGLRNKLRAK